MASGSRFYGMAEKANPHGTIIYQRSHDLVPFKTGRPLPADFAGPLWCELDADTREGVLPTFFTSPALIARKGFAAELRLLGLHNIEVQPVIIRDDVADRCIEDYVLLNILGRVPCAQLGTSDFHDLGDEMRVFNKLVLDSERRPTLELFLLDEDTDRLVISERVYRHLAGKGYPDIHFEALES